MSELEKIKRYYDTVYYGGSSRHVVVTWHLRNLVKRLGVAKAQQVLDIACGKGEWLIAASENGALPSGIDLSSVAIDVCKANLPQGDFHVGCAEQLPFPDATFDLITCLGSLEHFVEPEQALREMVRVAKLGARFLILVPNEGFFLRRLGMYSGTRQTVAREVVRPISEWIELFNRAGLSVDAQWRDLHVLSRQWITSGPIASWPIRALVALSLSFLPVACQYQVYYLCRVKDHDL